MARLNEPSAAIDSLDALKRRFIRQNREIARVNSTQSVRIRNLEGDVSRLLSENLALRERVIGLHHEVEKRPGRAMLDGMNAVKGRLESKLTELGELVQELGIVTAAGERRRSSKRRSIDRNSSKRFDPDQRTWRNGLRCSEFAGGLEGRLPPILEDKYFPRKTLDTEDLFGMFSDQANVTDSPDLGPPPVGHFEDGEPGALDYPREPDREDETTQRTLFANLETRKRRRETTSIVQTKSHEVKDAQPLEPEKALAKTTLPVEPLESGAKCAMTPKEGECNAELKKSSHGDDIMFDFDHRYVMSESNKTVPAKSNKVKAEQHLINPKIFKESSENRNQGKARDARSALQTKNRKALGPKSANTDPTSPIKLSKTAANEKFSGEKEKIPIKLQGRSRVKDKPQKNLGTLSKEQAPMDNVILDTKIENDSVVPPSPHNNPSPESPGLQHARQTSRDTPPPSNLQVDTADTGGFGTAGRSTRRPRGSVSYAEPNLRAKMRRPTSDLIDAVTTVERAHSLTASKSKEFDPSDESAHVVKKESEEDPDNVWKIGTSDGTHDQGQEGIDKPKEVFQMNPATTVELPTVGIADRRRRTVGYKEREDERSEQEKPSLHPGASSAIATLMAGSQRSIRREEEKKTKDVPRETKEIYDLNASSPTEALEKDIAANGNVTNGVGKTDSFSKDALAPHPRRKERERATLGMQGAKRDGTATISELKSSRSIAAGLGQQQQHQQHQQQQQQEEGLLPSSRAERLAVRRRSMMI